MRPTPEGVGNAPQAQGLAVHGVSSMRPTPEGVGNPPALHARGAGRAVFNEAHARRRGKFTPLAV